MDRPVRIRLATTSDRVRGLLGEHEIGGLRLHTSIAPSPPAAFAELASGDADVAEMSLAFYVKLVADGDDRFVGMPVFPLMMFRHESVLVATASPLASLRDLAGRNVAVDEYWMTLAVWLRGIVADEAGLDPAEITWIVCRRPVLLDAHQAAPPPGVTVVERYGAKPVDLVASGAADAAFATVPRDCAAAGVRPLLRDVAGAEEAYFSRTSVLPIMHLLAASAKIVAEEPSLVPAVQQAFAASRDAAVADLLDRGHSYLALPLLRRALDANLAAFGPALWRYGVEANRASLDVFVGYALAQGLIATPVTAGTLFPAESPGAF